MVALLLNRSSSVGDARGAAARERRQIDMRGNHGLKSMAVVGSQRCGGWVIRFPVK